MSCLYPSGCWKPASWRNVSLFIYHGRLFIYHILFCCAVIATGARMKSAWLADPFLTLEELSSPCQLNGQTDWRTWFAFWSFGEQCLQIPMCWLLRQHIFWHAWWDSKVVIVKRISIDHIIILALKADEDMSIGYMYRLIWCQINHGRGWHVVQLNLMLD